MVAYCTDCTTACAVDLQFCPNCGSRHKSYTRPVPQPEPRRTTTRKGK